MAMAQKYLFIAISFYRNIVRENVSCELGLNENFGVTFTEINIDLPIIFNGIKWLVVTLS